ncbi:type II secretion system protein [Candidatus Nomurabacteria bacterium]|nr:type II secretion system protein [Candidatus Nomurabacteria bacterium]MCB9820812.1 type II secretion system protein [Candidatus Nomurabacteria bacterium]
MYNRAFTIIELLITISIIGALASIVLGAIGSAKDKAADTAIKGNLDNIRSQAYIYFAENGDFGAKVESSDCTLGLFADSVISSAVADSVAKNGGEEADCVSSGSGSNADSWAISVPLKSDTGDTWCIDSEGIAVQSGIAGVTGTTASCE